MQKVRVVIFFTIFISTLIRANASYTLTTSGGVSLGNYKAGFNYFLIEFIKKNKLKLNVLGGASAGGFNSFLSIDQLCTKEEVKYNESHLWNFWTRSGLNEIYDEKRVSKLSLFHRDQAEKELSLIKEKFRGGYSKSCNYTFAIPVTNVQTFDLLKLDNISTPSIRNYFVIKIRGNDTNAPVRFSNVKIDKTGIEQRLLPFTGDFEKDFGLVQKLLFATTAFPVAFSPVKIPNCYSNQSQCHDKNSRIDLYYDGGVLDNAPIDIVVETAKALGHKSKHLYLDSANHAYEILSKTQNNQIEKDLGQYLLTNIGNVLTVTRLSEENKFLKDNPAVRKKIMATETTLPLMSSPLYAFFGFFDSEIRKYDFILGMTDADVMLRKYFKGRNTLFPELHDKKLESCIHFLRSNDSQKLSHCQQQKTSERREKLLQISLIRAFGFCHEDKSRNNERYEEVCYQHRLLKSPLNIQGEKSLPHPKGNDQDILFSSIDDYDYKLDDIDGSYQDISSSRRQVHQQIKGILENLESKQNTKNSIVLGLVDSQLLRTIDVPPPNSSLYTNIGTAFEVGFSKNLSDYFSLNASTYIDGVETYLTSKSNQLSIIPALGFDISPTFMNTNLFKFKIGSQLGRQVLINGNCKNDLTESCKNNIVFINTSFTLLDRINAKLAVGFESSPFKDNSASQAYLLFGYNIFNF